MNTVLLEQIVKHVLASLMVIPSDFIDPEKTKSLASKEYLLNHPIVFELGGGESISNRVWGCQLSAEDREIKMLLADCSQEKYVDEYCLLVQLKDAPAYGVYFINSNVENSALISCSVNNSGWLDCNTYLQATFLAGMEQLKDINFTWNKCTNYSEQFKLLQSFINHHDSLDEE